MKREAYGSRDEEFFALKTFAAHDLKGESLVRHVRLSNVGSLGKADTLASENPLPQSLLRGLDLTYQVARGAFFPQCPNQWYLA
jgi:hypothetical protein